MFCGLLTNKKFRRYKLISYKCKFLCIISVMKKLFLLIILIILISMTYCFANNSQENMQDSINFYYVRAREYNVPSYKTRTQAGQELIKLINNAQKSIDFAFYGFSYQEDILSALINAKKRGVKVRGIVDINVNGKNDYSGTDYAINVLGNGVVKTDYLADIQKLEKIKQENPKKYRFFYGHIMHNKFCIIDNSYIWTGTLNISTTGTGGFNENIATVIKSKELAKYYKKEFEQMYLNNKFHENKEKIFTNDFIKVENSEVKLFFSPNSRIVEDGIIPELKQAKKYIYISMFLITNEEIVNELIAAKKRGVDVKLIIEANHAAQQYTRHHLLRKNHIPVKVENWAGKMHTKTAVIDDNTIISGSANWTNSAFNYNDENLSIYKNVPNEAQYLKKEFLLSWKSIPLKWKYFNPDAEGKDSPNSCEDGIDNNHNGLIDIDDPLCK